MGARRGGRERRRDPAPRPDAASRREEAPPPATGPRAVMPRLGPYWPFVWLALLLLGVYRLPPDTSLRDVESVGVLRVCVPAAQPPLATGEDDAPGIDVELLRALTSRAGWRLQLVTNQAIGRGFDPRNWRLTRAQCSVVAGGVVTTQTTRSFLDTTEPHLETGWAFVAREGATLDGAAVGFLAALAGLDRIALSRDLRARGATVTLFGAYDELVAAMTDGEVEAAVTEALTARRLARDLGPGYAATWLTPPRERYGVALGIWKGDLTLKRRLERELAAMRRDGTLAGILASYDLGPIGEPGE